ncbi:MAG: FAD binding domain-containing protein [Sneathiellaceae bacterium]
MKPAAFDYLRPASLDEALAALVAEDGREARPIAGGQSLVPLMNLRLALPDLLVDLNGLPELAGIRLAGDRVEIGAMTRQRCLLEDPLIDERVPLLRLGMAHVGHLQTRARGTVGGSLVHADPAAELPLLMVTLGASIRLQSRRGLREVPAADFFVDAMETGIAADEILVAVSVPVAPPGSRHAFRELARRHGDFAIVAVAAQCGPAGLALGVGGLEKVPRRCTGLERALTAGAADRAAAVADEVACTEPLSDLHAGAAYRRRLAEVLIGDCLAEVLR